jgi:hypothetical protein
MAGIENKCRAKQFFGQLHLKQPIWHLRRLGVAVFSFEADVYAQELYFFEMMNLN